MPRNIFNPFLSIPLVQVTLYFPKLVFLNLRLAPLLWHWSHCLLCMECPFNTTSKIKDSNFWISAQGSLQNAVPDAPALRINVVLPTGCVLLLYFYKTLLIFLLLHVKPSITIVLLGLFLLWNSENIKDKEHVLLFLQNSV